ncbi:uncharacterized protein DS421_11g335130 [Arachis hypogaea]|uniref:Uncharacterized protein n=1 Tax=Arachis hypogaea TaxID=3818 RepID=A0A445ATN4_ARAHY|nr:uncharacterized protein DS421_11g335130 [Arachis hypogaea]RYR29788.1 hypothetical protein Ahy_B01g054295 [Arachis hypogaea]
MLEDVREGHGHLTTWLHQKIKKALLAHWETDEEFRHRRLTNRANKASARSSKYIGSLATFMNTKSRLIFDVVGLRCNIDVDLQVHPQFEGEQREICLSARLDVMTQQSQQSGEDTDGSTASVIDPDVVWCEIVSVPYKNHIYKLGSFFASSLHTSTLRPLSASATSRAIEPGEDIYLRLQVQEVTRSLHEQAQELTETRKRYQEILTHMMDTDDLKLEWRK